MCEHCGRSSLDYLVNGKTLLSALEFLAGHAYGRPPQSVEHSGEVDHRAIFEEHPPDESREQWLERMGVAQTKLDEFESEVAN